MLNRENELANKPNDLSSTSSSDDRSAQEILMEAAKVFSEIRADYQSKGLEPGVDYESDPIKLLDMAFSLR